MHKTIYNDFIEESTVFIQYFLFYSFYVIIGIGEVENDRIRFRRITKTPRADCF
jgi:hypothetical protein